MRRLIGFGALFLMWAAPAQSASDGELAVDFPDIKSEREFDWEFIPPLERVPPRYPNRALNIGQEGWVHVGFTIDETGSVTEPVVIGSYPGDVFHKATLKALESWRYEVPSEDDSYSLPASQQVVITYTIEGENSVRPTLGRKLLRAQRNILAKKDMEDAKRILDEVGATATNSWLRLYELAALEQSRSFYAFVMKDYEAAATYAERTLRLSLTFDDRNIGATHRILFSSYVNLRKYDDVVRVYDDWLEIDPSIAEEDFAPAVEKMRADIARRRDG